MSHVHARRNGLASLAGVGCIVLLFANDAQAYLDAGSASMLFQAVGALLFSAVFVLRNSWRRIWTLLSHHGTAIDGATSRRSARIGHGI
jgi:hypothetical protein